MPRVAVVIPIFNEEGNIKVITQRLTTVFEGLPEIEFKIIFVDDGSTDQSLKILRRLTEQNPTIFYLSLSKNFGKDNALMAGIHFSDAEAVITMDADLQHPPELVGQLIRGWESGYDVVYAYRRDKNQYAGFFTRVRSQLFYNIVNKLSDVKLENGISDFKLMDSKVIDVLTKLPEDKPFLRGVIKWVGFKQMPVEYEPDERNAGSTKYDFSTLISLAANGLTSFSTKPLSFAIYLGFFFSAILLLYIPYVLASFYFHWDRGPGWASVIVTIAFFGGLQLMIMGIIGLYLGKTFIQGKGRPKYIIQSSNLNTRI